MPNEDGTETETVAAVLDAAHWQRRLDALAVEHGIPGAVLGILRLRPDAPDEMIEVAHGVLNQRTGVQTTTDSVFLIGSITKAMTATVVMRLVDEGKLDLDVPVATVLPELELSDPEVTRNVTLRHLLTHTSGIDGDVFTDTGRGDDCVERYVALLAEVAQNHPLGATFSYCNSGYALIGRVIEKVTGKTWRAALREHVVEPLGLEAVCTLPEEALLYRAALGHVDYRDGKGLRPSMEWGPERSTAPAGGVATTAASLLTFARMHLTGGLAADGERVLSAERAADMAARHAEVPDPYARGDSWGLGLGRMSWDGHRLIGHDGATSGQTSYLRMLPERGLAVVLLTNADESALFYGDLFGEVFAELAGIRMPARLGPADPPVTVDASAHHGRYERAGVTYEYYERAGRSMQRVTLTGPHAETWPVRVFEHELVPADSSGDLFVVYEEEEKAWFPVTFYRLPTGEQYVHRAMRATPKVA